ncbi:hypothetical protein BDF20DRAFT_827777 [Mycotypha africana]|uniref:uncharacterized protein n=1 Tax=Mycotypha africana TaxID=64632 RepID=UPI002301CACB|nr:uncharacterized protein BDF20DRAFT_827777 [Mycotypha africana]KAI8968441.1 hypothetical protein BDF20DRAFT_827777 [Mycotypha africana]
MDPRIQVAILESLIPTTVVDITKLTVRRTPLYNGYARLRTKYLNLKASRLEEKLANYAERPSSQPQSIETHLNDWSKRVIILEKMECIAPMVESLIEETQKLPVRMREAYMRQWKRLVVRKAVALIKFVQNET